jgi:hypothetical protein
MLMALGHSQAGCNIVFKPALLAVQEFLIIQHCFFIEGVIVEFIGIIVKIARGEVLPGAQSPLINLQVAVGMNPLFFMPDGYIAVDDPAAYL